MSIGYTLKFIPFSSSDSFSGKRVLSARCSPINVSTSNEEKLIQKIRERIANGKVEVTPSAYDTAWVAMVPSREYSGIKQPRFPQCLDWIMENQKPDGSWGLNLGHPYLVKDALSCTLACLLAFRKWGTGHQLVQRGPKKLPVIGNLHLLLSNPLVHHVFRDLASKYGPLMHLQIGEVPFLIVSSVEVAKQVLKTHDVTFANRPPLLAATILTYNYTTIAFSPYGEYWRHLRKICTLELLSSRRVQYFRPIREEENTKLAKWIASNAGSPVNLSEGVYQSSFGITTRASIGKKTGEQETVTAAIKEVVKLASGFCIADFYPSSKLLPLISRLKFKLERISRHIDSVLGIIIDEHRVANNANVKERSEEDLVDVLLKFQEDDADMPLATDNIKAVLLDMFIAGAETSANVVEWAMSEMIKNPSTLKRAQEEVRQVFDGKGHVDEAEFHELKYLKLVIRETMRLHPPVPLLVPRENSQRSEINGYEIPAKTRVMINAWALGRDPRYWNDADKFVPERFMDSSVDYKGNHLEYIPFGAGRRMCPGMSFGTANVEFTLAMLLYHFDWEMPNGIKNEDLDMTEAFGATVTRKNELHLIPTVGRPSQLLE